jgi:hypothetical protein
MRDERTKSENGIPDEVRFAWSKDKHDSKVPPEPIRSLVQCKCEGKLFLEVKSLNVVKTGSEATLDILPLGFLCMKCNAVINTMKFMEQVLNEGKRPNIGLAPPPKESA